jgi:hypothetical protein
MKRISFNPWDKVTNGKDFKKQFNNKIRALWEGSNEYKKEPFYKFRIRLLDEFRKSTNPEIKNSFYKLMELLNCNID